MSNSASDFEIGKRYTLTTKVKSLDAIVQRIDGDTISVSTIGDGLSQTVSRKDITDAKESNLGARSIINGPGPNWYGDAGKNIIEGSGGGGGTSAKETGGGVPGKQYHVYGCNCGRCYGGGKWV